MKLLVKAAAIAAALGAAVIPSFCVCRCVFRTLGGAAISGDISRPLTANRHLERAAACFAGAMAADSPAALADQSATAEADTAASGAVHYFFGDTASMVRL